MKSPELKFDINKVKDLLKKLSFLKNNLALLVPIIIVVVAALLFIPTKLLSDRLKNTITQQSVKTAGEIDRLIKDVNEAGQAEAMKEYTDAYAKDPCTMEDLMKRTTMRELLTYKLFPDTNETSPLLFEPVRQNFMTGVEAMVDRMGGGTPPAREEIDTALQSSRGASRFGRRQTTNLGGAYPSGGGGGPSSSYRTMNDMDRKIIDKLCEDRARTIQVYATPAELDGYWFWSDWKFTDWNTAVRQSWYWQMGYWILGDVVDTVQQMNQSGTCVLDSPVKRIMNVGFTLSKGTRMVGGRKVRRTGQQQEMPSYAINLKTAMAAPPCTGRFCNAEAGYDVMHFEITVIVSADQVMHFIQELCSAKTHKFRGWYDDLPEQVFKHNQITVLEDSISPVDLEGSDHGTYRYGPGAVVQLDLICEYLFICTGYDEVKPKVILNDIQGISDEEAM